MSEKLKSKDIEILKLLRKNSRNSLVEIGKKTKLHPSTVQYIVGKLKKRIIEKNTCLLNWSKLGLEIRINFVVKAKQKEIIDFLIKHRNVNSVSKVNNSLNLYIETIFRNMKEAYEFIDDIEEFDIQNIREYHIIDDIVREKFYTS